MRYRRRLNLSKLAEQKPEHDGDGGVRVAREAVERGNTCWAARAGVGRPGRGGSCAGPEGNRSYLDKKSNKIWVCRELTKEQLSPLQLFQIRNRI
jgi:hypothetical protein